MHFTDSSFILAVADPERSAGYYCSILDFEKSRLDLGPGWSVVERDGIRVCFGACADNDDWVPPGELSYHNWFAYIVVDDIEAYFSMVQERGGEIVKELTTNPSGSRDFTVRTIDGHGIMFGTG